MTRAVTKKRLDALLSERGLFASRSRAAAAVMAGDVTVGDDGRKAAKPGELVRDDVVVHVREQPKYVSRGGIKLANALAATGLAVEGRLALDVGVSTGGFTDCLLRSGASGVIAVDVGYGDIHLRLREDPRVTLLERTNARTLTPEMLPAVPSLAAIDVSFISLRKILPAVLSCMADRHDVLAMIKPQFEVGREWVGKGGVVRDRDARLKALVDVGVFAREQGESVLGYASSGLPGPKGNRETFVWLAEAGRDGAATDREEIEQMAGEAEQ